MKPNPRKSNHIWQLQEAKAKFSQLVNDACEKGYQTVSRNGEPLVVILSKKEFDRMTTPKGGLLEFFKAAPCQDVEIDIQRSKDLPRDIDL